MIVAVCADKGSPGVTTLALTLALVWPGERLLLEADPSGADLAFRLRRPDGRLGLDPQPSVLSLAVDARAGLGAGSLPGYAQKTALGVAVIPGAATAEDHHPMRELWPRAASEAAAWDGVVIVDLGRLQLGHPSLPLAQAATVVVVLARPSVEGLYRLRHRVVELEHLLAGPAHAATPGIAVAVLAPRSRQRAAIDQTRRVLEAAGSTAGVVGAVTADPPGVAALYSSHLGWRLTRSSLLTSAAALAQTLIDGSPGLTAALPSSQGVVA